MTQLTVITSVFNGEDYLESTINSVLECIKGISAEYLIINDGSTDETANILNLEPDVGTVLRGEEGPV